MVLQSTYSRSDNDANPPGALLWTLGEPGTFRLPDGVSFALTGPANSALYCSSTAGIGVMCIDETGPHTYLWDTPINEFSVAPDGTVWAVGGYDGDNGGLYHITPGSSTNATPPTT